MSEDLIRMLKNEPNHYKDFLKDELERIIEMATSSIQWHTMKNPVSKSNWLKFQTMCKESFDKNIKGDLSYLKEVFDILESLEQSFSDETLPAWRPTTGEVNLNNIFGLCKKIYKKKLNQKLTKQAAYMNKLEQELNEAENELLVKQQKMEQMIRHMIDRKQNVLDID